MDLTAADFVDTAVEPLPSLDDLIPPKRPPSETIDETFLAYEDMEAQLTEAAATKTDISELLTAGEPPTRTYSTDVSNGSSASASASASAPTARARSERPRSTHPNDSPLNFAGGSMD